LKLRYADATLGSYCLLHMIPIFLFDQELAGLADGGPWGMLAALAAIEFAILLPLTALTYRFGERPFLALKAKRRPPPLTPALEWPK